MNEIRFFVYVKGWDSPLELSESFSKQDLNEGMDVSFVRALCKDGFYSGNRPTASEHRKFIPATSITEVNWDVPAGF